MTRTLTQQPSGIYTVDNLGATDWDLVLSNFSTLACMIPAVPCSFSVLAGCGSTEWVDPASLSVCHANCAEGWGSNLTFYPPSDFGCCNSVLMTDGAGCTSWADPSTFTVSCANYTGCAAYSDCSGFAGNAGTWGPLSPPSWPGCSNMLLASNGDGNTNWVEPGCFAYGNAVGWGNSPTFYSPPDFGCCNSVLTTDGAGCTFWTDPSTFTVSCANYTGCAAYSDCSGYACNAGTWGPLSAPTWPGCTSMLLISNGDGSTNWADPGSYPFGNAATWDGLCAPGNSSGFLYNDGCGNLSWAGLRAVPDGGSWNDLLYNDGCGPAWLPAGSCGMVLAIDTSGNMGWTYASCLSYGPSNPDSWYGPPPSTMQEALDRLASAISTTSCVPVNP